MKKLILAAALGATMLTGAAAVAAQDAGPATDRRAEWQAKLDTNKDGTVSAEEREAGRAKFRAAMLQRFDTDKDGQLSQTEREAMRAAMPHRGGKGGWHHGRGGRHGGGLTRMDTNKDGVITRQEAIAAATARFDRLDLNKDGKIDQAERAKHHETMKARWGAKPPAPNANPGQ